MRQSFEADATSLSNTLKQAILAEIKANHGMITFARYMELALYAPGLGYYNNGCVKIGKQGDFVTAPEISPLFGQCLARQCQQVFEELGPGEILELGPGTGKLAADILLTLESMGYLPKAYYLLELSPDLKQRQLATLQQRVPHLLNRIQWLNSLPAQPITGIILANEVLDAMPVHRFCIHENAIIEIYVGEQQEELCWRYAKPNNEALNKQINMIHQQYLPSVNAYTSEVNLMLEPWVISLSNCLEKGLILLLDYGFPREEYYHPDRTMGTLVCHHRQQVNNNPLWQPGLQDITAHVDFTAIAETASKCNLDVSGYTHQAAFLLNCGLLELINNDMPLAEHWEISQQIKCLTLPSEMGELFKGIALTRHLDQPLLGFVNQDRRHYL
jgi:SAM-dependent MidA family methyltransferase